MGGLGHFGSGNGFGLGLRLRDGGPGEFDATGSSCPAWLESDWSGSLSESGH